MDLAQTPRPNTREGRPAPVRPVAADVAGSDLRLAGTASLTALPTDDPRLAALRRACALLESLEAERQALDQRLESARRLDPMRHVSGKTSLDVAVEETRALIRELDELLCAAAESEIGRAHV